MSLIRRLADSGKMYWRALPVIDRYRAAAVALCVPLASLAAVGAHVSTDYGSGPMITFPVMDARMQGGTFANVGAPSVDFVGRQAESVPTHERTEMTIESTSLIEDEGLIADGDSALLGEVQGMEQGPSLWAVEDSYLSQAREGTEEGVSR